jgi:hypothetical protein
VLLDHVLVNTHGGSAAGVAAPAVVDAQAADTRLLVSSYVLFMDRISVESTFRQLEITVFSRIIQPFFSTIQYHSLPASFRDEIA